MQYVSFEGLDGSWQPTCNADVQIDFTRDRRPSSFNERGGGFAAILGGGGD